MDKTDKLKHPNSNHDSFFPILQLREKSGIGKNYVIHYLFLVVFGCQNRYRKKSLFTFFCLVLFLKKNNKKKQKNERTNGTQIQRERGLLRNTEVNGLVSAESLRINMQMVISGTILNEQRSWDILTVYVTYPAARLTAIIAYFGSLVVSLISTLAEGLCVCVCVCMRACAIMSPKQIRGQFWIPASSLFIPSLFACLSHIAKKISSSLAKK